MDAEKMSFENNSFDLACCSFGLHELGTLKTLNQVIKEIMRVLKPQGKFILADYCQPKSFPLKIEKISAWKILGSLREPPETLKFILNITMKDFCKKFSFISILEKNHIFGLIKIWELENKK